MELQLVSKETALLARELGFNEICHNIFITDLNRVSAIRKISIVGMRNDEVQLESLICTIPEQELLAKWLRDVHTIQIRLEFFMGGGTGLSEVYNTQVYTINSIIGQGKYVYDTYEEALEQALLIALNYLKNLQKS